MLRFTIPGQLRPRLATQAERRTGLDAPRRIIAKMKLLVLLLCALFAVEVSANNEGGLAGTWVVDVEATERFVLKLAPLKDAKEILRGFAAMGAFLSITMIVIEDDSAEFLMYGDTRGKGKTYKLVSQDQAESKYVLSDKNSSRGELAITALDSDHIRVRKGNDQFESFVLWKRGSTQPIRSEEALKKHLSVWQTSLEKIKSHLLAQDILQAEAVPPLRWGEEVMLQDGRRIDVEREVNYTYDHSFGDAGSGFQISRNKLRNHHLRFKHTDTGEIVAWQGDPSFTPVLLDLLDGVAYLVLSARPTKVTERIYGCTELPFVYLRYDADSPTKWRAVPADRVPRALKRANLGFVADNKPIDRLSADAVQESIARQEESSGGFIQRDIPRDYREWRYRYKSSYRNERNRDDCRLPPQPPPDIPLPAPIDIELEVVGGHDRILRYPDDFPDKSGAEVVGTITRRQCAPLFKIADPENRMLGELFVKDPSGVKKPPYTGPTPIPSGRMLEKRTERHCNGEFVWFVAGHEYPQTTVITKYTVFGDFVYSVRFRNPETAENKLYRSMILDSPTVENGYFIFHWRQDLPTVQGPPTIYSHRITTFRFREPDKPRLSSGTEAAR